MLTLHDVVKTAEAQKRFPNWIVWLVTLTGITLLAVALSTDWFSNRSTPAMQPVQQIIAPVAEVNPPVQVQEPEVVVPATPLEIEVPWVLLGTGLPITETMDRLEIPWEKWIFLPGTEAKKQFNFFTHQARGYGDGTAYFLVDKTHTGETRKENPGLYFSINKGGTWFKVKNPYPGESITTPSMSAAIIEGEYLVLFFQLQPEAWVGAWWSAKIPLSEIEGLRP